MVASPKTGFEEIFDEISKDDEPSALSKKQNKYKTSALTEDNLKHIADKLENAMQQKQLYLNAALSLPLLAKNYQYLTQLYFSNIERALKR